MLFNNNQKPNKYFLGFLGFLSSFSFLSCCVCGNPGTWGWCLRLCPHPAYGGRCLVDREVRCVTESVKSGLVIG